MKFLGHCVTSLAILGALACLGANPNAPVRFETVLDSDASFLQKMPDLTWGIDPFERTPGYAQKEIAPPQRLQGVVYDDRNPVAVIDGEEYKLGEYVADARIAEIGKNYVLLERGESLKELVLPPGPEGAHWIDIQVHKKGRTR